MEINSNNYRKGIMFGILVGIVWGLDGVLMGQTGLSPVFTDQTYAMELGISPLTFAFSPLVTAFFHESFCFFWVAVFLMMKKQLRQAFYILLHTKKGRATALAALVGSPIGMSAYLLGIKFAGAPYASSISVIYPGVGALISWLVLKEKLSKHAVIGIAISLLGSFMLGFKPSGDVPATFMKGVLFACLAVLGWALEGVIIGFAMKHVKGEDTVEAAPQQLLCLRYFIAMIAYAVIVLPAIQGYSMAGVIVSQGLVFRYAGIAILGAITYLSWYKAVDLIGAAMGTALNSTAALWTIIFTALLFKGNVTPTLAFWGVVIVIGVFIFAVDPVALSKKKNRQSDR